MKRSYFHTIIFSLFLVLYAPSASAGEKETSNEAIEFVKDLTDQAIYNVVSADINKAEKALRFRKLFKDAADIPTIARFVLGRHWKEATDEEKEIFLKDFKNIIILSWSKRFDSYVGQTIKFTGTRASNSKDQIYVDSKVIQNKDESIEVVWRLRKKDDKYQIIDISVANASMVLTYKKEYSSVIKNTGKGVKGLIESLEKKISQIKLEQPEMSTALY